MRLQQALAPVKIKFTCLRSDMRELLPLPHLFFSIVQCKEWQGGRRTVPGPRFKIHQSTGWGESHTWIRITWKSNWFWHSQPNLPDDWCFALAQHPKSFWRALTATVGLTDWV